MLLIHRQALAYRGPPFVHPLDFVVYHSPAAGGGVCEAAA
jgi:hypothetical protein